MAPPPRISQLITLYPTAANSAAEATATPDALALYDGQWKPIKPGIEQMALRGRITSGADEVDEMIVIARIDPRRVQLKVQYAPTATQHVREWLEATQADVVINGGYFDEQNVATALVIVDGVATGKSYSGFGGLFELRGNCAVAAMAQGQTLSARPKNYICPARLAHAGAQRQHGARHQR